MGKEHLQESTLAISAISHCLAFLHISLGEADKHKSPGFLTVRPVPAPRVSLSKPHAYVHECACAEMFRHRPVLYAQSAIRRWRGYSLSCEVELRRVFF